MRDLEKTKLVGSDFDDTITLNSMEVYIELYLRALAAVNLETDSQDFKEIVQQVWGQRAHEVINHAANVLAVRKGRVEAGTKAKATALKKYEAALRSGIFAAKVELVPGSIEVLQAIKERGVQIGLSTGLAPEILEEILRKYDVPRDLFVEKVSAYDIAAQKPNSYSLRVLKRMAEVIKSQRILNKDIVYVGDSANDVRMARDMPGVEPVVVLTGNLTRERAAAMGVAELNILDNVCYIEEVLERREKAA